MVTSDIISCRSCVTYGYSVRISSEREVFTHRISFPSFHFSPKHWPRSPPSTMDPPGLFHPFCRVHDILRTTLETFRILSQRASAFPSIYLMSENIPELLVQCDRTLDRVVWERQLRPLNAPTRLLQEVRLGPVVRRCAEVLEEVRLQLEELAWRFEQDMREV